MADPREKDSKQPKSLVELYREPVLRSLKEYRGPICDDDGTTDWLNGNFEEAKRKREARRESDEKKLGDLKRKVKEIKRRNPDSEHANMFGHLGGSE